MHSAHLSMIFTYISESMDITQDPVAAVQALVCVVRSSIDLSEMKMDLLE